MPEETKSEAEQKHWAIRLAGVLVPAIVSSLLAFVGAGTSAKTDSAEVKNKAESGYQFVREALTELRTANSALHEDVAKLAVEVADLRRRIPRVPPKKLPPAPKPTLPTPPPTPVPLPADLDKALDAQKASAPPAVAK